jgi:uncharacterized membrane protein YcfT
MTSVFFATRGLLVAFAGVAAPLDLAAGLRAIAVVVPPARLRAVFAGLRFAAAVLRFVDAALRRVAVVFARVDVAADGAFFVAVVRGGLVSEPDPVDPVDVSSAMAISFGIPGAIVHHGASRRPDEPC